MYAVMLTSTTYKLPELHNPAGRVAKLSYCNVRPTHCAESTTSRALNA